MLREWFFVAKDQLDWKKLLSVHRSGEAARSVPSSLPVASNQFSKLVILIDPTSTYPYIYSTHFGGLLVESNYITSCSTNSSIRTVRVEQPACGHQKQSYQFLSPPRSWKDKVTNHGHGTSIVLPNLEVLSPKGTQGNSRLQHNLQP